MSDTKYISQAINELYELLLAKNESYGNSALDPLMIYSKADPLERINMRIDDKLSRTFRGKEYPDEDNLRDLAGHYIMKRAYELKQLASQAVNVRTLE
jgi:hypothetical protein